MHPDTACHRPVLDPISRFSTVSPPLWHPRRSRFCRNRPFTALCSFVLRPPSLLILGVIFLVLLELCIRAVLVSFLLTAQLQTSGHQTEFVKRSIGNERLLYPRRLKLNESKKKTRRPRQQRAMSSAEEAAAQARIIKEKNGKARDQNPSIPQSWKKEIWRRQDTT